MISSNLGVPKRSERGGIVKQIIKKLRGRWSAKAAGRTRRRRKSIVIRGLWEGREGVTLRY